MHHPPETCATTTPVRRTPAIRPRDASTLPLPLPVTMANASRPTPAIRRPVRDQAVDSGRDECTHVCRPGFRLQTNTGLLRELSEIVAGHPNEKVGRSVGPQPSSAQQDLPSPSTSRTPEALGWRQVTAPTPRPATRLQTSAREMPSAISDDVRRPTRYIGEINLPTA